MWRWGLKILKLRILLQKAEAGPKTYSTKLGKSDTVRCRGWRFLLSRRWQPSGKKYHGTQAQEPGKGVMLVHPGWRRRPSAGGSEVTSWGRTADVWRAAPPEGSAGRAHRDGLPAAASARAAAPQEQGWPVQPAGRHGRGSTAQATGKEELRGPTALGSALSQILWGRQEDGRATRDRPRQRGPGNSSLGGGETPEERTPRKMTPVILTLKTAHSSLSLSEDFFRP